MEIRSHLLVAPYQEAWVGGPDLAATPPCGRIRKHGEPIDEFPEAATAAAADAAVVRGNYLYGGPLKVHFGHVMVDTVIRLWAFDPSRHAGVIFPRLAQPRGPVPDWVYAILALFGLRREHVIEVDAPTVFETVEFAEPGSTLGRGPQSWYLDWLKSLPLEPRESGLKKILLGRSHMIQRGTVLGERYFEAHLRNAGFTDFRPELHDIHTQAAVIKNAEQIVFTEGSGIYSIELLAASDAHVFMLPRRRAGRRLFEPHVSPRAKFSVLGDLSQVVRRMDRRGIECPASPSYLLSPQQTFAALVDAGLIAPAPFSLAEFECAEAADSATYFGEAKAHGDGQLVEVRTMRGLGGG